MKVTARMWLVGLAAAMTLLHSAGAAYPRAVWDAGYGDILGTQDGPVSCGLVIVSDESAAFIEACRPTQGAGGAGFVCGRGKTWRSVTVCSPVVGSDPVRRYADPSFWAVAGSPIQTLDFLLADAAGGAAVSEVLEFAGEQRYIAHDRWVYSDVGDIGADGAAGPAYVAWASWNPGF